MPMTRPTRRSPIRLLSASRNSSLKASRSLNRIAGPSLGAGRSFEATDHRAIGERIPRDLKPSVDWVDEYCAETAVGERVGSLPGCGERSALHHSGVFDIFRKARFERVHVQVERIGDLVALDCPAFAPNVSKGAQP